ncbi:alpha-amylase family glycosyl hydrolase [Edaphobacter flagellatus]|uniref:alpha-amylase family glycosyl hydrolase n=1 Tax=Edaphobacter flagellatus TaxID=1933044 RepID=UPI0021B35D90|nr:alpha-amylase family glycosyl hydrolase [Edaphobacter flagellatus]
MTSAPWWKHSVIYQADPRGFDGLHSLATHLDYIHSIGVDALLLTPLSNNVTQAIDPALGTLDDFDEIVRNASQFNIRVLVQLDPHAADLNATSRLWLAHGVAGFYIPGASSAQLAEVRRAASSFAGQRIVISDLASIDAQARGSDASQLVADGRAGTQEKFTASAVRPALEATQQLADQGRSIPLLFSDAPALKRSIERYGDSTHNVEIAKQVATMLLTTRAATMLFYSQELGLTGSTQDDSKVFFDEPKKGQQPAPGSVAAGNASPASLLNWYRQLSALTHSNRTISSGAMMTLNHDDQNVLAWVRKPQAVSPATPAIVVVENLSAQPVTISLKADIQRLRLKGSFLRTVLRSDNAMGGMHLDGMTLPPFGVFIGELRY